MEHSSINYDIVYNNYTRQIKSMKVGHIGRTGIKKIAKPVLLLALIKGIESGVFTVNRIEYEAIAEIYESVFKQYADMAKQSEYTPPFHPFYHLHTSRFWHLNPLTPHAAVSTSSASAAWLHNNVDCAYIDQSLWNLLQQKDYRRRLAEFIVENNIKTATASSRKILRMFLNWLVAI